MDGGIHISSASSTNYTKPGFTEIREGFDPANPKVGTITHEFAFSSDPWSIVSTTGITLAVLSKIVLSVSKVFNPQNTTESFAVLSWTPQNYYRSTVDPAKPINLTFKDENSAVLLSCELPSLEYVCGITDVKSRRVAMDSKIFDRIKVGAFTLSSLSWVQC